MLRFVYGRNPLAVNLFIDTNIFLSFYHLSGEDLEELDKLAVLIKKKQVQLLLPRQVRDEFYRNREKENQRGTQSSEGTTLESAISAGV